MTNRLESYFPKNFEPNGAQSFILSEIQKALDNNEKFIIINAPTATGKSFIAKTISNYSSAPSLEFLESCHNFKNWNSVDHANEIEYNPFGTAILTVTKTLQDQYLSQFNDGSCLKGKANYVCRLNEIFSCENGVCSWGVDGRIKQNCFIDGTCDYLNKRNQTVKNKCSFYTYAMFESLPDFVKKKQFIICDEASELEDELVNRNTYTIYINELSSIGVDDVDTPDENENQFKLIDWTHNLLSKITVLLNSYKIEIDKKIRKSKRKQSPSNTEMKKLNTLKKYSDIFTGLSKSLLLSDYIMKFDSSKNVLELIPYNVNFLANKIFDFGEHVILMSATIVNHKKFAKNLGIDKYHYIEVDSPLDPKKAPIKIYDKYRPNFKNKNQVIPMMMNQVIEICNEHKGEKGIIHTHSMDILNLAKKSLGKSKRFLYREMGSTNEMILKEHTNSSKDTVLVSPSMTHGVDLKGDLGKFQIIMKAPYPSLGNVRIKKKMEEDFEWYMDKMLSTLIQTCGRCNRTKEDFATTYILDANILDAIRKNERKLPKYFKERFF